jgi:aminoglycoside phosphotransferase (APT) family kinase protein
VNESPLQYLLAMRKACVQMKAEVLPPQAARLDLMAVVLAKLISDLRDLPSLQTTLLVKYAACSDEPGEPIDATAGNKLDDAGSRLDGARFRVQQAFRKKRESELASGSTRCDLKTVAGLELTFWRACERAVNAEIRRGEAVAESIDTQGDVFDTATFRNYLTDTLAENPAVEVIDMKLASRGFSKKTILIELRNNRVLPREIALRIDRAYNFLGTTVIDEFGPLVALHRAGIRLPQPLALEPTGKILDGPFIIFEKKAGNLIGNNFQSPGRNAALAVDVAQCLAQVHRTPIAVVPGSRGADLSAAEQARSEIDVSYAHWSALGRSIPLMEAAFNWLYAHVHWVSHEQGIVHGDFNFNNMLISGDRISGIVDWEFLHAGNPGADLGWFYYGAEGICGWHEFLKLYEEAGGFRLDPQCLDFFILLGQTRLAVMILQTESGFNEGRFDDLKFGLSGAHYTNISLTRVGALLEARARN